MTKLPTAILGRTGIEVTRLGYGAGHRKPMTEKQNRAMVRRVVDSGISLIDTANDYGNSEEMIGLAISDRYSEVTVSTKCGCSPRGHIWTRENLFRGVHESLERLKTDRIDIMQFHGGSVREFEENGTVRSPAGNARAGLGEVGRRVDESASPADVDRLGRVRYLPTPLLCPRPST